MSNPPDTPSFEAMLVRMETMRDTYATKTDLAKSEGKFEKSIGNLNGDLGRLHGEVSTIKKLVFGICGVLAAVFVALVGAAFANVLNLT